MRRVSLSVLGFLLLSVTAAHAADNPRERLLLDQHWRFHLGDAPDAGSTLNYPEASDLTKVRTADLANQAKLEEKQVDAAKAHLGEQLRFVQGGFDASGWRELNLPHDWVVELPFSETANYQHGFKDIDAKKGTTIAWYRRTFSLPTSDKGRVLTIDFDGVFRNSLVWLNGHCLGRHPSGYSSFEYDITKLANCGEGDAGKNTLVVRVDAGRFEGWFYEGAGIYRHVWLNKMSPVHVAHCGTYVTTTPANGGTDGQAHVVTVREDVQNEAEDARAATVSSQIVDADGKPVAELTSESKTEIAAGKHEVVTHTFTLPSPHLWSPETPYLYTLMTTVKGSDGAMVDRVETPFGVRTVHFDVNQGVFLNGKHYEIQGTCNHQDHAGVGSAIPDAFSAILAHCEAEGDGGKCVSHVAQSADARAARCVRQARHAGARRDTACGRRSGSARATRVDDRAGQESPLPCLRGRWPTKRGDNVQGDDTVARRLCGRCRISRTSLIRPGFARVR